MKKQLIRMWAVRGEPANRKLTIKQRKFIDGKLHGQSSAQTARNAGYSESVARKADHIILDSPTVRAVFHEILVFSVQNRYW